MVDNQASLFALGNQKEKPANMARNDEQKLADTRLQGLGMQKETNIKQDREKFAVSLRKDRREEELNKRRNFLGPVEMAAGADLSN